MDVHFPQHTLLASVVPPVAPAFVLIIRTRGRTFGSLFHDKSAATVVALRGIFVDDARCFSSV
jgi:hypothetical protein